MQKTAENEGFCHFLKFGVSEQHDIANYGSPKCFSIFGKVIGHVWVIMCINWAKNEDFGYFLEFGTLVRLYHIFWCYKMVLPFHHFTHVLHDELCIISMIHAKMRLVIYLDLTHWSDFMLHILILPSGSRFALSYRLS